MIDIAVIGVIWGTIFQDYKWRVAEWSSWHPVFKCIGLWAGYEVEYIDILLFLLTLTAQCQLYQYSIMLSYAVIAPTLLIVPLLLLHIYNPQVRWGWCTLHSAVCQYWYYSWAPLKDNALQFVIWLDNTTNLRKFYDFLPKLNMFYYFVIGAAFITIDKTYFIEAGLPLEPWPFWYMAFIGNGALCLIMQPILWANAQPDHPRTPGLQPIHRMYQNYLLYSQHFLKWNFFYREAMPWRFFQIMRLPGVLELCSYTSYWYIPSYDRPVLWHYKDSQQQYTIASLLDLYVFAYIKPMTQKGTYRNKTACDTVYATSD